MTPSRRHREVRSRLTLATPYCYTNEGLVCRSGVCETLPALGQACDRNGCIGQHKPSVGILGLTASR